MKNIAKYLSVFALLALCLTACSDDDGDYHDKNLIGRWDYVHSSPTDYDYYEFSPTGNFVYVEIENGRSIEESGLWSTRGGTLKLSFTEADGTVDVDELRYRISGETLYIWDADEGEIMADVYKLHK